MLVRAKGEIMWIDDEVVGYKCECGKEIAVNIYKDRDKNKCPKCGKRYVLQQINRVWELLP